jgi:hypothetical protein
LVRERFGLPTFKLLPVATLQKTVTSCCFLWSAYVSTCSSDTQPFIYFMFQRGLLSQQNFTKFSHLAGLSFSCKWFLFVHPFFIFVSCFELLQNYFAWQLFHFFHSIFKPIFNARPD